MKVLIQGKESKATIGDAIWLVLTDSDGKSIHLTFHEGRIEAFYYDHGNQVAANATPDKSHTGHDVTRISVN